MNVPYFRHPVGIAWYSREDYPCFLGILAEEKKFPPSFDEWLVLAEDLETKLSDCGLSVIRVTIEPETFLVWRAAHGLPADASSLDLMASEYAFWQQDQTREEGANQNDSLICPAFFDCAEEEAL